jgi:hypothetical protein
MGQRTGLDYGRLMQKALRGLLAEVLGHVAEHGLEGEHHFYIGIDTRHPGVDMPGWLRARHPEQMTIVLQDWFEDLAVIGDRFQVTLNFSNRPETLVIPFAAVQTFIDPSVRFGLKFDEEGEDEAEFGPLEPDAIREPEADTLAGAPDGEPGQPRDDGDGPGGRGPEGGGSADVVRLDTFRKT